MKSVIYRTIKDLTIAALIVAGFIAGIHYQDYQTTKQRLATAEERLAEINVLALNELYLQSASFAVREKLTPQDQMLASIAMTKAKLCTWCRSYWESNGSSDYHRVPFIWTVAREYGAVYEIVPATMFKADGQPPTYDPAFSIYFSNRAGTMLRVDASGAVYRRVSSDGDRNYEWVLDPSIDGAGIKRAAVEVALHNWTRSS